MAEKKAKETIRRIGQKEKETIRRIRQKEIETKCECGHSIVEHDCFLKKCSLCECERFRIAS